MEGNEIVTLTLDQATQAIRDAEQNIRDNWVAMAEALIEIRDNALWKQGEHTSFSAYIEEELGYGRQWVYKLMKTPEVAGVIPVTNPTVASELVALPENQWQTAWEAAKSIASTDEPSSRHVRKAVNAIKRGDDLEELSRPTRQMSYKEDDFKDTPPIESEEDALDARLNVAQEKFNEIHSTLRKLWNLIDQVSEEKEGVWLDMNSVRVDFKNLSNTVKFSKPFAVCPFCNGKGCDKCLHSGFLCKERFEAYAAMDLESGVNE